MNDRFKFRVWQTELKQPKMKYNSGLVIGNNQILQDGCIVMQCTGLKDKNGKLIYEGDVVRVHRNHLGEHFVGKDYVVKFYQYQYWLHNCGYHPLSDFSYRANQNLEIIGNIYENKELLND